MPLDKDTRSGLVEKYRTHEGDTGSPEVQVAIMTERIRQLTDHMNTHRKDRSSLRGLQKLVGQRRRLLKDLSRTDLGRYRELISQVGLRR